jgi:hypothetical protein
MPKNFRKNKKYSQGHYTPKNSDKYVGNKTPRYLSSWELRFFRWCDNNPKVVKWGSETCAVPYVSPLDNRMHKYLVDNVVHMKNQDGSISKYLIEIKPKKQTLPPTKHGNKKKTTIIYESHMYVVNTAKWKSAELYCKKHGYKFVILTEDELFSR